MKFKIPFLNKTIYFGKSAQAVKQSYQYGAWQNTFAQMVSGNGFMVSIETLYTIYNNVVDIKQAIFKKQQATAREGYVFTDPNDTNKPANPKLEAEANKLINREGLPFNTLKSKWQRDRGVAGNAYIQILKNNAGKPLGLDIIDPRTMTIFADVYGNVQKYAQDVYGQNGMSFEPSEIVHDMWQDSTINPIFGASPIEQIIWEAKGEMAAQMQNYFFYENNAVPSHILIVDDDLDEKNRQELERQLDKKFKGGENRFKAGIIPHLKDIKTISLSQKEMQFIETRTFSTRKIVVAFGVPAPLLGYTDGVQRGNMAVIWQDFYENTIRPDEVHLEELMNNEILPKLGFADASGNLLIRFKVKPSNYDDKFAIAEQARKNVLSGVFTPNEARAMQGMGKYPDPIADELGINGVSLSDLGKDMAQVKDIIIEKQKSQLKKLNNLLC